MDDLDLTGISRLLDGEEQQSNAYNTGNQMTNEAGPSQQSYNEAERKPFEPAEEKPPKGLMNNLDLTGIAYGFPEEAVNEAGTAPVLTNTAEPKPSVEVTNAFNCGQVNDVERMEGLQESYEQLVSLGDAMDLSQGHVDHWPNGDTAVLTNIYEPKPSVEVTNAVAFNCGQVNDVERMDGLQESYEQLVSLEDAMDLSQGHVDHWPNGDTAVLTNIYEPKPSVEVTNAVAFNCGQVNDVERMEGLQESYEQLVSLGDAMDLSQGHVDHWPNGVTAEGLIAMNEAYTELLTCLASKVDLALTANKEKQAIVANRIQAFREAGQANKKKVPVQLYLPPYFKDENMMCPRLSSEARIKQRTTDYDPLMKEERKWTNAEIQQLKKAVKEGLVLIRMEPYTHRKRELEEAINGAGQDVSKSAISKWKDEVDGINRKDAFFKNLSLEELLATADSKEIDWTTMSNINFNGMRTAQALQLKWTNEVCPRWNHDPWTAKEIKELKSLREEEGKFVSWAVLADQLGTRRSPWQCFCKYKKDIYQQTKEWTQAEDEKLIALCSMMQMNGNINWDKVTYYMPGRSRQQVRVRYMRTLDKNVKHGKWSEQEDLLLMCAVNRLGAQDWSKIAKAVAGRTDTQCRERWVNVLDRRVHPKEWTLEEDEKLLYLKSVFAPSGKNEDSGPNHWSKCTSFLEGRTADQCRYRYYSLVNNKIRLCLAKNVSAKDISLAEYNSRVSLKKIRVNRLYRRFENMIDSVAETDEDRGANFVHEELERQDGQRFKLTDELKMTIENAMAVIEQKHKEGKGMDQAGVLSEVEVTQIDVTNFMKRREKHPVVNKEEQPRQHVAKTAPRQKGRKIRVAKAFQERLEVKKRYKEITTSKTLTEDEVQLGQYEALLDTVTRLDSQEWSTEFQKFWKDAGGSIAEDFTKEILTGKLPEQIARLETGERLKNDESLPISYSNCDFLNLMERARPRLMRLASAHFHRVEVGILDPEFVQPVDQKFNNDDALNIKLTDDIKKSKEYLALKAVMRNAVFEPMVFEDAVANTQQMFQLKKRELSLRDREVEDDAMRMGLVERPVIMPPVEVIKPTRRAIQFKEDERNMPTGQWLLMKTAKEGKLPMEPLPPVASLLKRQDHGQEDEELVEEEEEEIDVGGPPNVVFQNPNVSGPSTVTSVLQAQPDVRKPRNDVRRRVHVAGASDEKKAVVLMGNDDTATSARPVSIADRRRSSLEGGQEPSKTVIAVGAPDEKNSIVLMGHDEKTTLYPSVIPAARRRSSAEASQGPMKRMRKE